MQFLILRKHGRREESSTLLSLCNLLFLPRSSSLNESQTTPRATMDDFTFGEQEENASNVESELDQFRQQWHAELQSGRAPGAVRSPAKPGHSDAKQNFSIEDQAKYIFLQGVHAEQSGHLMEAIQYYRRAVQLVPDIEFKVDYKQPRRVRQESESSAGSVGTAEDEPDEDLSNLIQHFNKLQVNSNAICQPETSTFAGHFSMLPVEVINYIFKWVVSSELDILSLENLACVCRGFFLCARDEELWRLICQRIWGVNCGSARDYGTWRAMFLERPHLRFNGCYISKMSYFREGERGLDNNYKPYQVVEYYRYVRFFPEGKILMMTSPEDPYSSLPKIQGRHGKVQGMLHGYYKMVGNQVTAVLKRQRVDYSAGRYRYFKQRQQNQNDSEQAFHVEFLVSSAGQKKCARLIWNHYAVHTIYKASGQESIADFTLNNQSYPSLMFSRVRSYMAETDAPLA